MDERLQRHPMRYFAIYAENVIIAGCLLVIFAAGLYFNKYIALTAAIAFGLLYLIDLLAYDIKRKNVVTVGSDHVYIHEASLWGGHDNNIHITEIKDVEVTQNTFLESFFNYGTVTLHVAEEDPVPISYVRNPKAAAKAILAKIEAT